AGLAAARIDAAVAALRATAAAARATAALAAAIVAAGVAADALPGSPALAGDAVLLGDPFAALLLYGLHGRAGNADGLHASLVARLLDVAIAGLADLAVASLADVLANLGADFTIAGLANRPADGLANFMAVLFADLLLDLDALLVAVLLAAGLADL